MNRIDAYGVALLALVGAGCTTTADFEGPRPGETWHVSTESLSLHERPDALSPTIRKLSYKDAVVVQKDIRVAPAFNGDRNLFPENLIPCWVRASAGRTTGYLPIPSLASEWLIANQNPNETISDEGMTAAKRGFSESETDAELASMRGAAGAGRTAAVADMAAVERALASRRDVAGDVATFISAGRLSGAAVKPVELSVEPRGTASSLAIGTGRVMAQGLNSVATAVDQNQDDGSKLVSATGKAAAGMVHSEIGPVQEFQMGKTVASRLLPLYKMVDPSDPRAAYLSRVGTAMALASNDPMPYQGYLFLLVESDEVNAFAVPGGFVFVTTAMLDFLRDEDELAAIIGHEMGHMELRHGIKAVGKERVLKLFSLLKDIGTEGGGGVLAAQLKEMLDEVFGKMLTSIRNGYGIEIESQADWRSLQLCARLGYDTKALYEVLERFKKAKGSYGGASYPQERGADILKYRKQLGHSDTGAAAGRDARAARYAATVRK